MNMYPNNILLSNKSVLFNVPNLIIYLRLFLLLLGMALAFKLGILACILIFISSNLDALDGYLARKLNQTSKTGAIFDFTLDRLAITCFSLGLSVCYVDYWWFFLLVLLLDLASHFAHIYALAFSKNTHHKEIQATKSKLFSLYYNNKPFLWFCCFSYEVLYTFLFLNYLVDSSITFVGLILCFPGFLIKNYIHVIQFMSAIRQTLELDLIKD